MSSRLKRWWMAQRVSFAALGDLRIQARMTVNLNTPHQLSELGARVLDEDLG